MLTEVEACFFAEGGLVREEVGRYSRYPPGSCVIRSSVAQALLRTLARHRFGKVPFGWSWTIGAPSGLSILDVVLVLSARAVVAPVRSLRQTILRRRPILAAAHSSVSVYTITRLYRLVLPSTLHSKAPPARTQ